MRIPAESEQVAHHRHARGRRLARQETVLHIPQPGTYVAQLRAVSKEVGDRQDYSMRRVRTDCWSLGPSACSFKFEVNTCKGLKLSDR